MQLPPSPVTLSVISQLASQPSLRPSSERGPMGNALRGTKVGYYAESGTDHSHACSDIEADISVLTMIIDSMSGFTMHLNMCLLSDNKYLSAASILQYLYRKESNSEWLTSFFIAFSF